MGYLGHSNGSYPTLLNLFCKFKIPILCADNKPVRNIVIENKIGYVIDKDLSILSENLLKLKNVNNFNNYLEKIKKIKTISDTIC